MVEIQKREVEGRRIVAEAERQKRKEKQKEKEWEDEQRMKRQVHNRDLRNQIQEQRIQKKSQKAHELKHPQNELFPKIEEPPS